MGFHGPGHNSKFHLHLHLIAEPLKNESEWMQIRYGKNLIKVDQVIEKSKKGFVDIVKSNKASKNAKEQSKK